MPASALTAAGDPPGLPSAAAVLARAGSENFPVASRALPAAQRAHLLALYGFARLVDDIGDEAEGDRDALLDWADGELERVYAGTPTHPLMRTLQTSVRELDLPRDPFARLIAANRRDQTVSSYRTLEDLLGYCRLSAAPVGELVLHVFGCATPERVALSDNVCAGLQLVEHLQDVREDRRRGRVYLPAEDLRRCGCTPRDLDASEPSTALRGALALEIRNARRLLADGIPLLRSLPPRPAFAVAAFVAGGRAALVAIERAGYDVLGGDPRPSAPQVARALGRVLRAARASS